MQEVCLPEDVSAIEVVIPAGLQQISKEDCVLHVHTHFLSEHWMHKCNHDLLPVPQSAMKDC